MESTPRHKHTGSTSIPGLHIRSAGHDLLIKTCALTPHTTTWFTQSPSMHPTSALLCDPSHLACMVLSKIHLATAYLSTSQHVRDRQVQSSSNGVCLGTVPAVTLHLTHYDQPDPAHCDPRSTSQIASTCPGSPCWCTFRTATLPPHPLSSRSRHTICHMISSMMPQSTWRRSSCQVCDVLMCDEDPRMRIVLMKSNCIHSQTPHELHATAAHGCTLNPLPMSQHVAHMSLHVTAGEVCLYNWTEWLKEQRHFYELDTAGAGPKEGEEQQVIGMVVLTVLCELIPVGCSFWAVSCEL